MQGVKGGSSNLEATEKHWAEFCGDCFGCVSWLIVWFGQTMPTSIFTSQSTWFASAIIPNNLLVSFWFVPRCTHIWEIWNMSHGVWYMHIHFHRCFIFGWEIVIIQFSLLNYDLPLTYLVKRLPYRVSVSIQLHVASSFKNAAYPSMFFLFPWWFCWWGMGKCRWDSSYLGLSQGESQGGANGWRQRRTHCPQYWTWFM